MPDRFYADSAFDKPTVELSNQETHHLANVLRHTVGDRVRLFNGQGAEANAEVQAVSRNCVELRVIEVIRTPELPRRRIIIATAVPKGDRFRWLVEKTTELGVDRLIPLVTSRSVVEPGLGKIEKMRQTVIAAAKQSGARRLMQIDSPQPWSRFLDAVGELADTWWVAHPGGEALSDFSNELHASATVLLTIGPEGGFSDEETSIAVEQGAKLVGLGANILRIETAAIALAAHCRLAAMADLTADGLSA